MEQRFPRRSPYCCLEAVFQADFWGGPQPGHVIKPFSLHFTHWQCKGSHSPLFSRSELGWKSKRLRLLSIVIRAGCWTWVGTCPIPPSGSISHGRVSTSLFLQRKKKKRHAVLFLLPSKNLATQAEKTLLFLPSFYFPLHDIYEKLPAGQ